MWFFCISKVQHTIKITANFELHLYIFILCGPLVNSIRRGKPIFKLKSVTLL